MTIEKVDTLIVGAGQAGIAASEHLSNNGVSHLVLERGGIAERWRTCRWDSLVANGPAWHDRFPNLQFTQSKPDEFASKEEVADYFNDYANMIKAPVRTGVEVLSVERIKGQRGFRIETSAGSLEADHIIAATGPFQRPIIPPVVPKEAEVMQMHSVDYRNPVQLPAGAVLVVGAGSSGAQIADELLRAGRTVYLSVGPHDRPPRAYRGRDFCWWLGVLGKWDIDAMAASTQHVTIAVSGAHGGTTVDFRRLANAGMNLLGMTKAYQNGVLTFEADLVQNINQGDANYLSVLDEADAYVVQNGIELPEEPEARVLDADPHCMTEPTLALDLAQAGITSIIWATGFALDYAWLKVATFDDKGQPIHKRGIAKEHGLYFLGLPWQTRRGSSFIWGVWHDAKYVADHIAKQKTYFDYHDSMTQKNT